MSGTDSLGNAAFTRVGGTGDFSRIALKITAVTSWIITGLCGTAGLERCRIAGAPANALVAKSSQGADADVARTRALNAYKEFLASWKDADPDIPILKEAKAEYAKLQ